MSHRRLVFDLESTAIHKSTQLGMPDGLPDKIHCCAVEDVDTGERWLFVDPAQEHLLGSLCTDDVTELPNGYTGSDEMYYLLRGATLLIGHNIAGFDLPLLEKEYGWLLALSTPFYDTRFATNQIFHQTIVAKSYAFRRAMGGASRTAQEAALPSHLVRAHSLEAWGYRLQCEKGKHVDWTKLSPEMVRYCIQDVSVNVKLFHRLQQAAYPVPYREGHKTRPAWRPTPVAAMVTESSYAHTLYQQQQNGVAYDVAGGRELYYELQQERDVLVAKLAASVSPRWVRKGVECTPARTMQSQKVKPGMAGYRNYREGCAYQSIAMQPFNPGSGVQVANHLIRDYGWQPLEGEYTTQTGVINGKLQSIPKTSGKDILSLLSPLDFPTIPDILRYQLLTDRMGMLVEGKKSFDNMAIDGVIHGRVIASGTRTSRASHNTPNMNVPKNHSPYGEQMRALFGPTQPGWVQVGCDASGLELRCLGSVMYKYDGGVFAKIVLDGDIHAEWMKATHVHFRDNQKTFTYATIYGAGDEKRGRIILLDWREAFAAGKVQTSPPPLQRAAELGRRAKAELIDSQVGFSDLLADCSRAYRRGYVVTLDGRSVKTKSEHGTLNDLLQGDGAVVMKTAKWIAVHRLWTELGWAHGDDFAWMLDIHDEWQVECPPDNAEVLGEILRTSMVMAGERLGMNISLDGEFKIGANWAECH